MVGASTSITVPATGSDTPGGGGAIDVALAAVVAPPREVASAPEGTLPAGVAPPTEVAAAPEGTPPAGVAAPTEVAAPPEARDAVAAAITRLVDVVLEYGSALTGTSGGWGSPFACAVAQSSIMSCAVARQFKRASACTCVLVSACSEISCSTELTATVVLAVGVVLGCERHDVARKRMITSLMVAKKLEKWDKLKRGKCFDLHGQSEASA